MKNDLYKNLNRVDYLLLVSVLFLVILGTAIVYSSSSYLAEQMTHDSAYFFKKQMGRVIIGLIFLIIFALVDYRVWLGLSPLALFLALGLLLLLFTGLPFVVKIKEAARWLRIGGFQFQPSDFARYALILFLARTLHQKRDQLDDLKKGYLKHVFLVMLIVLPIAFEKDLSTAAVVAFIAFLMFFFADVKLSYLIATFMTFFTGGLAYILKNPYQLARIHSFIKQMIDKNMMDWQLQQSMISLALGGFWGQGIGNSRQKYAFLPEAHSDFIYSVIGEEVGLIGTVGVLILFFIIIYRGMKIAQSAPDGYGRLLASGITACIGSYALINAAVALAILPTTGLPMPFVSYGGSALISHFAAVGILINISSQCDESYMNYSSWKTYKKRLNRSAFTDAGQRTKKSTRTAPVYTRSR